MLFEAMQSLTHQIASAHQARTANLHSLLEGTRPQLREFDKAHQAMAHQQRERLGKYRPALARFESQRKATVHAYMHDLSNDHDGARARSRAQMQEFSTDRAKAHQAWQQMSATLYGKKPSPSDGHSPAAQQDAPAEQPSTSTRSATHPSRRSPAHKSQP